MESRTGGRKVGAWPRHLQSSLGKEETGPREVRELSGYVGFANIPNQIYRRSMRVGFRLNLMAVGASGLGKSTFLDSLFLADLASVAAAAEEAKAELGLHQTPDGLKTSPKTPTVHETQLKLKENGVGLSLTLVDTPGFGDQLDNSEAARPIVAYVEGKFEEHLNAENKVERDGKISDGRIHVCLYFVSPSGHGLAPLDVQVMRELSTRLNLIPLIAKADTLTSSELSAFKERIRSELELHQIKVYEFPEAEAGEEAAGKTSPFAVVGSKLLVETASGRKVRGRKYPWGVVEVDHPDHSDFIAFRDLLIRRHLVDLLDITHNVHYENYRVRVLGDGRSDTDPFTALEDRRRDHGRKLSAKEKDMDAVFQAKMRDRQAELVALEKELSQKQHRKAKKVQELFLLKEEKERAIAALRAENPTVKPWSAASSSSLPVPSPLPRSWSHSSQPHSLDESAASNTSKRSWIANKIHGKK